MALTNEQYDQIMREYSSRQDRARAVMQQRREDVYRRIPRLEEIDGLIASTSVNLAKKRLLISDPVQRRAEEAVLAASMKTLAEEKKQLLANEGYPDDYLQNCFQCRDCQDTGFIGREKCHCFRQAEIDLLYHRSGLRKMLSEETFDKFRLDYYSDTQIDPDTGISCLGMAKMAYRQARIFADTFGREFHNLFLYGSTGVGKTFLSDCIAGEVLSKSASVLYFSAGELFDAMARESFSKEDAPSDLRKHLFECDLLIIDDLGTEMVNSFVSSSLFLLVNERNLRKKPTVISSNLNPREFMHTYSERIFSRITSSYDVIKLCGEDIRLKKKFSQT